MDTDTTEEGSTLGGHCEFCGRTSEKIAYTADMRRACERCAPVIMYIDGLGYLRCNSHQQASESAVAHSYRPAFYDTDRCDFCRS